METKTVTYERPAIEMMGGVNVFFDRVLRGKPDAAHGMDWRARKIKDFIDSHPLPAGRNLEEVCKKLELSMSSRQARRLFKLSTGVGIRDYTGNKRLSIAKEQLEATNTPIKAIAADLGFQSTRQFRRRFKQFFGVSPLEFRKVSWNSGGHDTRSENSP